MIIIGLRRDTTGQGGSPGSEKKRISSDRLGDRQGNELQRRHGGTLLRGVTGPLVTNSPAS